MKYQHLDDCLKCSCNKNRQCNGYRVMVDRGYAFNPYKCEFIIGRWKKPLIEKENGNFDLTNNFRCVTIASLSERGC